MSVQNLHRLKKITTYSQLKYIVNFSKSIELISIGSYGLIYKIIVNINGLENITQFILKLVVIDSKSANNVSIVAPMYNGSVEAISKEAFISEHKQHVDIYNKFNMFGLNLVPAIYGSQPIFLDEWIQNNNESKDAIMTFMEKKLKLNKENLVTKLEKNIPSLGINLEQHNIGIILMECPVNYRTLQNILDDTHVSEDDKKRAIILGQSAHIQFMYQYDKYHGDPHTHNILINVNAPIPYPLYDGEYRGRAILIDFGRTHNVLKTDIGTINDSYDTLITGPTRNDVQKALVSLIGFIKKGFDSIFHDKEEFKWIFCTDYYEQVSVSCFNFTAFLKKTIKEKKDRDIKSSKRLIQSTRKKTRHRKFNSRHSTTRRISSKP